MFDWLADILEAMGSAITLVFGDSISSIVDDIYAEFVMWLYTSIYGAIADLFTGVNSMGAAIFDLSWVSALVEVFRLFGWALFVAGVVVAVFEVAIEYQSGRASIKNTALNIFKGFFACSLISIVPIELYKFCISLQNSFSHDVIYLFAAAHVTSFGDFILETLRSFDPVDLINNSLGSLLYLIAFGYCVVKVFFANIKRGGILLIQMAVGELYMFSVPRGYSDGFNQWCKQVAAICLTAFLQTTLLFLGLMTFEDDMVMGLGIMLAAGEVPKVAQQFGLDSSVRINASSIMYGTSTAVNVTKTLFKPK